MKKSLRIILVVILSGILGLTSIASGKNTKKIQKAIPVKIGVDSGTFGTQFHVAKELGYFKKYGIRPEISVYSYGIDTLNAIITGEVEVGEAMDFAALSRLSAGDLRIISFIQTGKAEKTKLVARDGISTPQDLKGKRLGVQKATVMEYIVAKYLDRFRIKQDEVIKEGLSSNAELGAAFERGDIHGVFFSGVFLDKALKVQGAKVIGSQADIPFAARGFLVVTNKLLKEKPQAAEGLLRALDAASKWIAKHPKQAGEIVYRAVKLPKEAVSRDLLDITNAIRLTQTDFNQLNDVYKYSVQYRLIRGGFNLEDKIVVGPLQKTFPERVTYQKGR